MNPGVAILIASALSAGAQGASAANSASNSKKEQRMRAKEMEREIAAGLHTDIAQRGAELEGQRLQGRKKLGQRRTQSLADSSDLVRRAFNI
jgi:hypothetical protein